MMEISGQNNRRWQSFQTAIARSEKLNKEMNLRFFLLQRSADLSNHEGLISSVSVISETIRKTNSGFSRLLLVKKALEDRTAFFRPDNQKDDFDIVTTGQDDYPSGFGAIPLIIGIGIAVVVLVSGALATVKVCDTIQQKAIADIKLEQLKAEQVFAASPPSMQAKWMQFKQIQAPLLKEIDRLSSNNTGFLGDLGSSIRSLAMVAVAAFVLFKVIDHGEK
jgi:hypothetical protein